MAYYAPGMGRAFHPRAVNFSRGWVHTSTWNLISMPILQFTQEIRNAVLMVHGENAHSRYFSEDAYKNMTSGSGEKWAANKELVVVPGAVHTDLYDKYEFIPFGRIEEFVGENLK